MIVLLENILRNHILICIFLAIILAAIFFIVKDTKHLNSILFISLVSNFLSFNYILINTNNFDFSVHLPLHLCYLTEAIILCTYFFNLKFLLPWLILNSLGGGITGFTNSNLDQDVHIIEYIHLYLSHFNLLLFSIIMFKKKFIIQKIDLYKSIILNASIFFTIIWINNLIGSNYWFTLEKPPGTNLTNILPDWPGYLIVMVAIGILSYIVTYRIFKLNQK